MIDTSFFTAASPPVRAMRLPVKRRHWQLTQDGHILCTLANTGARYRIHRSDFQDAVCAGRTHLTMIGVNGEEGPPPLLTIQDLPPDILLFIATRWFLEPTADNARVLANLSAVNVEFRQLLGSDEARRIFYGHVLEVPSRAPLPPMPEGGFGVWYRRFRASWLLRRGMELQVRAAARYWYDLWETSRVLKGRKLSEWVDEMDAMPDEEQSLRLARDLDLEGFVPEAPVEHAEEAMSRDHRLKRDFLYLALYGIFWARLGEATHAAYLFNTGLSLDDIDVFVLPRNLSLLRRRWAWNGEEREFTWHWNTIRVTSELAWRVWIYFPPPRETRPFLGRDVTPKLVQRWMRESLPGGPVDYYTDEVGLDNVVVGPGFLRTGNVPVTPYLKLRACASFRSQVLDLRPWPLVLQSLVFFDNDTTLSLPREGLPPITRTIHLGHSLSRPPMDLGPHFDLSPAEVNTVVFHNVVMTTPLLSSLRSASPVDLDWRIPGPVPVQRMRQLEAVLGELVAERLTRLVVSFHPALTPQTQLRVPRHFTELPRHPSINRMRMGLIRIIHLEGAGLTRIPPGILDMPRMPVFDVSLRNNHIPAEAFAQEVLRQLLRLFDRGPETHQVRVLDLRGNPVTRGMVMVLDLLEMASVARLDQAQPDVVEPNGEEDVIP